MGRIAQTAGQASEGARRAADRAAHSSWVERVARFGYVVRGAIYVIIGLLALRVAMGSGGQITDQRGALADIAAQPYGKLLLVLVAVGLAGYALACIIRAVYDPLGEGSDARGFLVRAGYVVSGLAYGALAIPAVQLVIGDAAARHTGTQSAQDWTAWLMSAPFGQWLVAVVGIAVMLGGLWQLITAVTARFRRFLMVERMSADEEDRAVLVGRFGHAALGVVGLLVSFFLVQAAFRHNPSEARGLDGALAALAGQPYGPWLLGIVAVGLICFGVYSALLARWVKIS